MILGIKDPVEPFSRDELVEMAIRLQRHDGVLQTDRWWARLFVTLATLMEPRA